MWSFVQARFHYFHIKATVIVTKQLNGLWKAHEFDVYLSIAAVILNFFSSKDPPRYSLAANDPACKYWSLSLTEFQY